MAADRLVDLFPAARFERGPYTRFMYRNSDARRRAEATGVSTFAPFLIEPYPDGPRDYRIYCPTDHPHWRSLPAVSDDLLPERNHR